jgi:hypothetical protein
MTKEEEILEFLNDRVFNPISASSSIPSDIKKGVRITAARMGRLDAKGMIDFFWSAIRGTEKSIRFSEKMKREGLTRFEDIFETFRKRFNEKWLKK